jgi:hypothetical protein
MNQKTKLFIVLLICLVAFAALFLVKPIPQDEAYHQFADQWEILGVSHFWNVISNIPFFLVGVIGTIACLRKKWSGLDTPARGAYLLFFLGVTFTGLGSAYYHLNPNTNTLFWDRLPMAVTFMAFFTALITEYINEKLAKIMLGPLAALGCVSVFYWRFTEQAGAGDLRLYALVQYLPVLFIPFIIIAYKARYTRSKDLYVVLLSYLAAKLAEHFDGFIYTVTTVLSGHTLKHFFAAFGVFWLLRMLRLRQRLPTSDFSAS